MANLSTATQTQMVSIVSVDLLGHKARGLTRQGSYLDIDTRYPVGAVHVVPAQYEQWIVTRRGQNWALQSKLPFGTDDLGNIADDPQTGTNQIGSSGPDAGPLNLQGSVVVAKSAFRLLNAPSGGMPSAVDSGQGALAYDTSLAKVVLSDGVTWDVLSSGGGGGGGGSALIAGEALTGTKNGINLTFTTANAFLANSTAVYRNGLREVRGVGYTETLPNTISFTTAPLSDDDLHVDYAQP